MLLYDGRSCIDIDECLSLDNICNGGQCHNTQGSFSCVCNGGLMMGPDATSCLDLDECIINPDVRNCLKTFFINNWFPDYWLYGAISPHKYKTILFEHKIYAFSVFTIPIIPLFFSSITFFLLNCLHFEFILFKTRIVCCNQPSSFELEFQYIFQGEALTLSPVETEHYIQLIF